MVVLRAEREEGWLILSAVTPPIHESAWLALQDRRRVNTLCRGRVRSSVCVCVHGGVTEKSSILGFHLLMF